MKSTSMAGFFSKKQYAAIALRALAIKLLNERCLKCSICAMFLSSSFTVSISADEFCKFFDAQLEKSMLESVDEREPLKEG